MTKWWSEKEAWEYNLFGKKPSRSRQMEDGVSERCYQNDDFPDSHLSMRRFQRMKPYTCEACDERFHTRDDLQVHTLTAHHQEENTSYPPPYGEFSFDLAPPVKAVSAGKLGEFRGIQGENNSCYLDSALMAMFLFVDTFDGLLQTPRDVHFASSGDVEYLRTYLKLHIVNNLRRRGFVPSMVMIEWRRMLARWFGAGVDFDNYCEEEEACEFVRFVLEGFGSTNASFAFSLQRSKELTENWHFPPTKASVKGHRGQTMLQLLPPKTEKIHPEIAWALEQVVKDTLKQEDLLFCNMGSSLILQLPRYGKNDRVIGNVVPNTSLWINCYGEKPSKNEYELQSLVVIGSSHFVAYLRVSQPVTTICSGTNGEMESDSIEVQASGQQVSWLYYDSMSDRDNNQNIPCLVDVTDELRILESPNAVWLVSERLHSPKPCNHLRRLVKDMSMAFYTRVDSVECQNQFEVPMRETNAWKHGTDKYSVPLIEQDIGSNVDLRERATLKREKKESESSHDVSFDMNSKERVTLKRGSSTHIEQVAQQDANDKSYPYDY